MKLYISRIILGVFLLSVQCTFAQNLSKNQFKVKGNCEMCKERIENTAKNAGAKTATYSIDSQTLIIETGNNTSSDEILKKIAEAGHDNEKFKASAETYEALPGDVVITTETYSRKPLIIMKIMLKKRMSFM